MTALNGHLGVIKPVYMASQPLCHLQLLRAAKNEHEFIQITPKVENKE